MIIILELFNNLSVIRSRVDLHFWKIGLKKKLFSGKNKKVSLLAIFESQINYGNE